ncbi:MAG: type III-A CRISPR-associated RAMP protein Csm3, partial [Methanobacteriota archaeon]
QTDLPFTEIKTEVVIDRITSRAMPRQMERVPAGARFDFEMVLNVYDEDNEEELVDDLFSAMKLLQNDYLGAAGSRGSGQVRFLTDTIRVLKRDASYYRNESEEEDVTDSYKNKFPQ